MKHLPSNDPSKEDAVLRPEVAEFAREMERALRANDHKPGWRGDSMPDLLVRLREEVDELAALIDRWGDTAQIPQVVKEAADVANFAMMLADLATLRTVHGLAAQRELRERTLLPGELAA